MYSQQNVGIGDDYVTAHRLDRRLAVIDRFYLDGVIVTKVSSKTEAEEMVSRWQEVYK